jgi:hypothetical protein
LAFFASLKIAKKKKSGLFFHPPKRGGWGVRMGFFQKIGIDFSYKFLKIA